MDKEYQNIYSRLILNKIKNKVEYSFIKKDPNIEKSTDEKILKVINSLILESQESKNNNTSGLGFIANEINNKDFITVLSMQYVALYNDNLELLKKILDNNISLDINSHFGRNNLKILDKSITEKIDEDTYIYLLKSQNKVINCFINSLSDEYEDFTNEEAIDRFANIINKNTNISFDKNGKKYYEYITKTSLKWFKDETLINASDVQKDIINWYFNYHPTNKNTMDKLSNLIENYNFSKDLRFWENFFENFTISEILSLTDEQILKCIKIFSNANSEIIRSKKNKKELVKIKKSINKK